jgi:hypothetical protein
MIAKPPTIFQWIVVKSRRLPAFFIDSTTQGSDDSEKDDEGYGVDSWNGSGALRHGHQWESGFVGRGSDFGTDHPTSSIVGHCRGMHQVLTR